MPSAAVRLAALAADASFTTTRELFGQSCLTRSSATGVRVGLTRHGVGRILSGAVVSQLDDCTSKNPERRGRALLPIRHHREHPAVAAREQLRLSGQRGESTTTGISRSVQDW